MRIVAVAALIAALVACADTSQGVAAPERRAGVEVFQGLGTWIDIYDTALYRTPDAVAGRLAARGVRTAWVETANDRSTVDVVDPVGLGRLVDSLHARGITVVAWYLPGHDRQARDLRRTRAMLSFRTPQGGAFDGVALDIESSARRTSSAERRGCSTC